MPDAALQREVRSGDEWPRSLLQAKLVCHSVQGGAGWKGTLLSTGHSSSDAFTYNCSSINGCKYQVAVAKAAEVGSV